MTKLHTLPYLRHYVGCGNPDRATTDHPDLFAVEGPDYEENSARLLCRDLLPLPDDHMLHEPGINR